MIENIKWLVLVHLASQAEVFTNLAEIVITILDLISIFNLGSKVVDFLTMTICQQDNLSIKSL